MRQKNQVLMWSDKELELIKAVFCDNEQLIYAIRKVLFQFPLTGAERELIKKTVNDEVYAILKKRIFTEFSCETALGQIGDLYQTLGQHLQTHGVDQMAPLFDAKEIEIKYLKQQFDYLKDVEQPLKEEIKLDDLKVLTFKSPYQRYVDTTARNFLISFIEQNLIFLRNTAGEKKESIVDAKERMTRNSNK